MSAASVLIHGHATLERFIFTANSDGIATVKVSGNGNSDRPAADLAVFNIFALRLFRVHENIDCLSAIRAINHNLT